MLDREERNGRVRDERVSWLVVVVVVVDGRRRTSVAQTLRLETFVARRWSARWLDRGKAGGRSSACSHTLGPADRVTFPRTIRAHISQFKSAL